MAPVPETARYISVAGDLKTMCIDGTSATATNDTVDTNKDIADAKGTLFKEIFDAFHIGPTGTRVDASWVAATGIVTLGTVASTPAVSRVFIIGR